MSQSLFFRNEFQDTELLGRIVLYVFELAIVFAVAGWYIVQAIKLKKSLPDQVEKIKKILNDLFITTLVMGLLGGIVYLGGLYYFYTAKEAARDLTASPMQ